MCSRACEVPALIALWILVIYKGIVFEFMKGYGRNVLNILKRTLVGTYFMADTRVRF